MVHVRACDPVPCSMSQSERGIRSISSHSMRWGKQKRHLFLLALCCAALQFRACLNAFAISHRRIARPACSST
eukprot:6327588-Amphidinium_carterae.1